ncbi:MFS transporter [Streptomyces bambusae]|uniref:MFS transporter n=1 Tax=Streptomyces bambusae TaxID=1550616 RepID=UPI001CFFD88F|nr:MFS transporter [Streptomyces bambusae]MCB5169835.1 MFS transporter [Streptomyces bambusae]
MNTSTSSATGASGTPAGSTTGAAETPAGPLDAPAPATVPATAPVTPDPPGTAATTTATTAGIRRLVVMTGLASLGKGLYLTVALLWFTRGMGFSAAAAGVALTAAGVCGVLASLPAGRLADRYGSRPVMTGLLVVQGACLGLYTGVSSYPAFVALTCVFVAAERGSGAVRATLYVQVLPTEGRGAGLGLLRVVLNCGIGAGAGLGALVLLWDTPRAYAGALAGTALVYAVAAAALYGLPVRAAAAADEGVRPVPFRAPLRDLPYLAVTALNAVVNMLYVIIEVAFPLWLVEHTEAPAALVGPLLMLNTVLVVALQVRATRRTDELAGAARAFRTGGLLVAACAPAAALAAYGGPWAAALAMTAAVVLLTLGEVLSQAGSWTLGYDLAPAAAMGAYQGVFQLGISVAAAAGPALLTVLVLPYGLPGWLCLGAVLAAASCALPPVARWAQRTRA